MLSSTFVMNKKTRLIIAKSANNWEHEYTLSKFSWFTSKQLKATSDEMFGVRKDINVGKAFTGLTKSHHVSTTIICCVKYWSYAGRS